MVVIDHTKESDEVIGSLDELFQKFAVDRLNRVLCLLLNQPLQYVLFGRDVAFVHTRRA